MDDSRLCLFNNDSLIVPPTGDYDTMTSKYDVPSSTDLLTSDDVLSSINDLNHISVSIPTGEGASVPAPHGHGSPASSSRGTASPRPVQERVRHEDFPMPLSGAGGLPFPWLSDSMVGVSDSSILPRIVQAWEQITRQGYLKINGFPDDILLNIFDHLVNLAEWTKQWLALAHVCRRWRNLVLVSPCRLDLRIRCTTRTPVRARLGIWPTFPIAICGSVDAASLGVCADNIMAALEHKDRVCRIDLQHIPNSLLGDIAAAMEEPFLALTHLALASNQNLAPVLPETLLGGHAPGLRSLRLASIPFLALGKLLPSATDLVYLSISDIPHSGYISPGAMVTCLRALVNLEEFHLGFKHPLSRSDRANRHLPPPIRVVLPTLSTLEFKGVSEYFEDVVAQIDTPRLNKIGLIFFNQLLFDNPQLLQFLCRTNEIKAANRADVFFCHDYVRVTLFLRTETVLHRKLSLAIKCTPAEWQLSSLAQVCCSSSLTSHDTLEQLLIYEGHSRPDWQDDIENTQWLEILHPFPAAKILFLSDRLALRIPPALQQRTGGGETEVLPALQNLVIEKPNSSGRVQEAIEKFVTARKITSQLVIVQYFKMQADANLNPLHGPSSPSTGPFEFPELTEDQFVPFFVPIQAHPKASPYQVPYIGASTDKASFDCPVCGKSYRRPQERDRHILMYLPYSVYCPFERCAWRSDRAYELTSHWSKVHATCEYPQPKREDCRIYDPKPLLRSIIRGELTAEAAIEVGLQAVEGRAQELGKVGIWDNERWRRRRAHPEKAPETHTLVIWVT